MSKDYYKTLGVDKNASDKKLKEVCKIACIHDFIMTLPNKYDTIVGEGGITLSGGQKQRLAIARAFVQKTEIILFDEATSALDQQTEKHLLDNLKKMTDKTVLIVTHRPAALDICDKIIRFTENGIEEQK